MFIAAEAKIRRVGYFGNPVANTDYTTFALAHTAATNNDTILIFPGASAVGDITKKLYIFGTGYWLDPNSTPKGNANQQAFASAALGGIIYFKTGSAGSVVAGLNFVGNTIYIGVDNITIRRNRDVTVNLAYNANNGGTPIIINNLALLENYELTINHSYNIVGFGQNNLNISNNFMESFNLNTTNNSYNGSISNNVWVYDATAAAGGANGGSATLSTATDLYLGNGAFLFANNILVSYTNANAASNYNYFNFFGGGNTVFNYNVILQSYNAISLGAGTGNVIVPVANVANIFQDFPLIGTNSADARYQLKANSPALQTNRPGATVDAGMYGGSSPYRLSMLPPIPSIYSLSSPQGNNPTGNTIQINVSTKGNN
jgi:hypothetical protein